MIGFTLSSESSIGTVSLISFLINTLRSPLLSSTGSSNAFNIKPTLPLGLVVYTKIMSSFLISGGLFHLI